MTAIMTAIVFIVILAGLAAGAYYGYKAYKDGKLQ